MSEVDGHKYRSVGVETRKKMQRPALVIRNKTSVPNI